MRMTDEQIAIINDPTMLREVNIRLTNPDNDTEVIRIGNSQIYNEQFKVEEAIADGGNIQYGKASSRLVTVKVADLNKDVTGWQMKVSIDYIRDRTGLISEYEYTWNLGEYVVATCERSNDKRFTIITAKDNLYKLNYDISGEDYTNGESRSIVEIVEEYTNRVDMYPLDTIGLINIDGTTAFYPSPYVPTNMTALELIQMISELCGVFPCGNQQGSSSGLVFPFGFRKLQPSLYDEGNITDELINNPLVIDNYIDLKYDEGIVQGVKEFGFDVLTFGGNEKYAPGGINDRPGFSYNYLVQNNTLTYEADAFSPWLAGALSNTCSMQYYMPCECVIPNGLQYELGDFVTIKKGDRVIGGTYVLKRVIQGIYRMTTTISASVDRSVTTQTSNLWNVGDVATELINTKVSTAKMDDYLAPYTKLEDFTPVKDKVEAIGTTLTSYVTTSKALSQSAWVDTNSKLELSKGVWMVTGTVIFASAANGRRGVRFKLASSGGVDQGSQVVPAASTAATYYLTTSWITTVATESDTITLQAYQSTSASLNATSTYLKAVKIA